MAVTVAYESDGVVESNLLVGAATNLAPVLTAGQTFPGRPATIRVTSATGLLDDDGTLYTSISFGGGRSSNGLFERAAGAEEFRLIVETGGTLPSLLGDVDIRNIGRAGINGQGASFRVNIEGNASAGLAYWNGETIVAVVPDFYSRLPDGQESFLLLDTGCEFELGLAGNRGNDSPLHDTLPSGGVVFQARSPTGGPNCPSSAILIFDGEDYTVVAKSGGAIPGATDATFGPVALHSVAPNGDIVYRAELGTSDGIVSYWLRTASGEEGLLFASGEEVEVGSRTATIDRRLPEDRNLIDVNGSRRVAARVRLDDDSISILSGTARLNQPYPSITSPGATNMVPVLTTGEPLSEPFASDEFFSSVGNATLRGSDGTLFYARLSSASDSSRDSTALWLYTPATGFERVVEGNDGPVFPSSSDPNRRLFVTDSGEVFDTTISSGTSRGGLIVRVLGPEQ